ncbi:MAG: hypothetical protein HC841_06560 [Verrucomicrobiae bacterium]|nr:hypothetical protein [Verrucomicrobiae bacterium]
MRPYEVFVNEQALGNAPRSGAPLQAILKFIRALADAPNTIGDFSEVDGAGRVVQVKVIGRHAITYWPDHAVCEVKITHIRPADR